jgi:hypothetical protein
MWISKQTAGTASQPSGADGGCVTQSGTTLAAYSGGEWRGLSLYAPGGVIWRPEVGEQVLLLRLGEDGAPCVAGAKIPLEPDLAPGELLLRSKGASLCLRNDGTIEVRGKLVEKEEQT